ncbi:hypothetical protein SLA2020_411170 [Shorea laevis]
MDCSLGDESLAILQLHKWDPPDLQLDLSEFREAFLSPTRELLLLLSYQCQALLVPLITGDSVDIDESESCDTILKNSDSTALCLPKLTSPSRSKLKDDILCPSGSATDTDNDFSLDCNFSRSNSYPFLCDVNSLAWGFCGDAYKRHKDGLFRELLFVSGNQGVIVHAFCHRDNNIAEVTTALEGEFGQGTWREWGPSSATSQNINEEEPISPSCEAPQKVIDKSGANVCSRLPDEITKRDGDDELSRTVSSKRWLRSFFTKAETIESEGSVWTRLPNKSSFPSTAKVVSFSICNGNLPLLNFHSQDCSVSKKTGCGEKIVNLENDLHKNLSSLDVVTSHSYKCTRVFSSNSHHLIGFFLTLVDCKPVNISDGEEKGRRNVVTVARLKPSGIQWIFSVKLEERVNICPTDEWADFQFSDDFLVCLSFSGLISFYAAESGEYVAHLDILQASGLNHFWNCELAKLSLNADRHTGQIDDVHDEPTHKHDGFFGRRLFRRLFAASHTSLLAVVDEYGVAYVICARDHVPEMYYAYEKLIPHYHHFGLGMLVGWEVGGSDVGCQRVYSDFLHSPESDVSSKSKGKFSFSDDVGSNFLHKLQDLNLNGTGCKFHDYQTQSHLMRNVFLPTDRFSEYDCIYFSPFGITRLIRRQNLKEQKGSQLVHFNLHTDSATQDDRYLNSKVGMFSLQGKKEASVEQAVGCIFQGCFYLVTENGLSVVLPSVSVSSNFIPVETIGYPQPNINISTEQEKSSFELGEPKKPWSPWKLEILDRVLLYEGAEEADHLCLENGWDLKISQIRRLQMTLKCLKFEEIKQSLEMLGGVNLAAEGILRLLLAAIYLISHKNGSESEISAASRLLDLATWFTTKMIREYGLLQHKNDSILEQGLDRTRVLPLPLDLPDNCQNEVGNSLRLHELAHFLEIIRKLQCQLRAKLKKPAQGVVEQGEALSVVDSLSLQDGFQLSTPLADSLESSNHHEDEKLALVPKNSLSSETMDLEDSSEVPTLVPQGMVFAKKVLPLENPMEMIARWKIDKLDLKTVVKDALLSGRLPLAVLQLHLHRSREFVSDKESHDTFTEVSGIGKAIAYDLFLKGESGLAIATLQKLGEDLEICFKELLFGTLRKPLRIQIAEEMGRYGYLGPYERKILERISLIERLYPSSSFWKTYLGHQKELMHITSSRISSGGINLHLLDLHPFNNLVIKCGEIDGVVLGTWTNVKENLSDPAPDHDSASAGYWAAAAAWSNAWDQRTIDRIVLDQPFLMGIHVSWESQLEYHIYHNDWEEVSKLLDVIPESVLSDGTLQIALDGSRPSSSVEYSSEFPDYGKYICSIEELDAVCMDVPDIKIFRLSSSSLCCAWLRMLIEQELVKKFIFLKEYWEGTSEIVSLLARSGFITNRYKIMSEDDSIESPSDLNFSNNSERLHADTAQALYKLLVHHCARYNLPNLLDLYFDRHKMVLDEDSLFSLLEAAGDCHWARWLLLSRRKGCEYDASFANTRSIMSRNLVHDNNLHVLEVDEIIRTIDDIAEGGGEMAALATLMYAPAPIQNCLSSGSVNRHSSSSAQCTLENLKPALQHFPTLWRTLVSACFVQETTSNFIGLKTNNALSAYLNWRDNIFFSAARDTSLLQMLPCWFPKAVRRLIQLFVQGPLGWESLSGLPTGESLLHRDIEFYINADEQPEISAVSWETTIQKHVQEELYNSSLVETGLGLEHHLHRGRALAAFNHLLISRVEKLKLEGKSSSAAHGRTNIQSHVQTLLASITQSEESILSSVMPLAITHFEDSVLVASCCFLMELCGLSASMLQLDVAALRRISSFYKSSEINENFRQLSLKGSVFHAIYDEGSVMESLARALADEYLHQNGVSSSKEKGYPHSVANKRPSRSLMIVLQHLEKASMPTLVDGKACGYWLLTGNGDGTELRSQQKAASQQWSLVTVFCQMHQLPLSTKYLAILARDNDWVGFLSEAQIGGYALDVVVQVASKEFSNPRLKTHIVTVLKSMQSRKKAGSPSYTDTTVKGNESGFKEESLYVPVELFGILADCEKKKNPGEALLMKAKELSWSILAMIASCFPDVSPLSCLTVWLEITAARETSSIKVNDIASQIANDVAAAVEATNSLPADSRAIAFHYNRRNPKRRQLMEPVSVNLLSGAGDGSVGIFSGEGIIAGEEQNVELGEEINVSADSNEGPASLSKMVAVLCEQHLFLPLLRAFEMFLPSCSLLTFIRALQAFSQMRLSEASAHLGSFSARIKEEATHLQTNLGRGHIRTSWISSTAIKAADAMLSTCPSPYEKRCLLQLLAGTDFGDGGSAATCYRRLYWKINLAEPSLRKNDLDLGNETLDDASLLTALEKNRQWDQARNWARQLEASGGPWKSSVHHVTETQAESMVAEWKEFLWDVPEERIALWGHCQTLFIRYSFPALRAGLFFLKHAEAVEKDLPARELHELLLLSLQWLSGMITQSNLVYPLNLLREIETRVWLLAVESEAQINSERDSSIISSRRDIVIGNTSSIIDRTANLISKMDNHINATRNRTNEKYDARENNQAHYRNQVSDSSSSTMTTGGMKTKRRAKGYLPSRRPLADTLDKVTDSEDGSCISNSPNLKNDLQLQDESFKIEISFSKWEERINPTELESAVLSLLEFGQITAAKQLQQKLSPGKRPFEFKLVDAALKLAAMSTPSNEVPISMVDEDLFSIIQSYNLFIDQHRFYPLQVLESLATIFAEGGGRGICKRIISVVRAANVLGLSFSEAFDKQPIELLQLLSLKAQESFEEAKLIVQTHVMPATSIAQILAESFLKGLLAAHRGGYMDSQKEEGPAPLLWRFSDFFKWAKLCPSEPEIGHALMRLVITGQEIPHACEVELLILSHHFYKSSSCLDGVDVLVALAATRVEAYVSEGDFPCLARLITGVRNFHALNFILGILIENGQLDLLLQKYSTAADINTSTADVRRFRMAVLTSLKHFNPNDLDAFAMIYNHFDMKHETAALLESQAQQSCQQWFQRHDRYQNEDLLDAMRYFIEAAEVHSSIDAGTKTRRACAQASLVSLQIRMPDYKWLNLSDTNARRALVEQSRFQEALIVAEAYSLNQPGEWALVLWFQMLNPELTEEFVHEFVAVLPLHQSMLADLARFYKAEMTARVDQSQFSIWLTGGRGLPADWARCLVRSFRCLLKRTRDLKFRMHLAMTAPWFGDVVNACMKALDKYPDNAGPLVLRKGHGGTYLPLM